MEELSFAAILANSEKLMDMDVERLNYSLSKIRAGKVSPVLLDGLTVDYYDNRVSIVQVANITVVDARTLSIEPWEKQMLKPIEKAIIQSNLGLTPQNDGQFLRISIPILTEERRRELVKQVHVEAENVKVSIRNKRRDAMEKLKKIQKNNNTSKDEFKDQERGIQELTDSFINKIERIIVDKDKEIMTI